MTETVCEECGESDFVNARVRSKRTLSEVLVCKGCGLVHNNSINGSEYLLQGCFKDAFMELGRYLSINPTILGTGLEVIKLLQLCGTKSDRISMSRVPHYWGAGLLCHLVRLHADYRGSTSFRFPFKDIADYIGVTVSKVSKYFRRVRNYSDVFILPPEYRQQQLSDFFEKFVGVVDEPTLRGARVILAELEVGGRHPWSLILATICILSELQEKDVDFTISLGKISPVTLSNNIDFLSRKLGIFCFIGWKCKNPQRPLLQKFFPSNYIYKDEIKEKVPKSKRIGNVVLLAPTPIFWKGVRAIPPNL